MPKCPTFFEAFQANMTALHMPVPTTLFATLQTSLASVATMMVATDASLSCGPGKGNTNLSMAVAQWGAKYGLAVHPLVMAQILRHQEVVAPGPHSYLGLKLNTAMRGAQ